jgi:hypothetical protein
MEDVFDAHSIGQVDILKIDVEGAEAELVRDGAAWLERSRLVVMEIHRKYINGDAVVACLERAGFDRINTRPARSEVFVRRPGPRRSAGR